MENTKIYEVTFKAEMTLDDVRAMKKCFADAMNEAMLIPDVWDVDIHELNDKTGDELTNKLIDYANTAIDDRCEMYGVRDTISHLIDNDFTKEELIAMRFEEDDIAEVMIDR